MNILVKFLLNVFVLVLVARIMPGIEVSGLYIALIVAIVLGFLNILVRPVLLVIAMPINAFTFGLFTFVINGLILWFVSTFIEGFVIDGLIPAIVGALLISVVSWVGERYITLGK